MHTSISVNATGADPMINILMPDTPVMVNDTALLQIRSGNASGNPGSVIPKNALRILIKVGACAVITGLSIESESGWGMSKISNNGRSAWLFNIDEVNDFDFKDILVVFKGKKPGTSKINATIGYKSKKAALNGDALTDNNTSSTSITVIKNTAS